MYIVSKFIVFKSEYSFQNFGMWQHWKVKNEVKKLRVIFRMLQISNKKMLQNFLFKIYIQTDVPSITIN